MRNRVPPEIEPPLDSEDELAKDAYMVSLCAMRRLHQTKVQLPPICTDMDLVQEGAMAYIQLARRFSGRGTKQYPWGLIKWISVYRKVWDYARRMMATNREFTNKESYRDSVVDGRARRVTPVPQSSLDRGDDWNAQRVTAPSVTPVSREYDLLHEIIIDEDMSWYRGLNMPDEDRIIFDMFYLQGKSLQQIGDVIGCTGRKVGQKKYEALQRIREKIDGTI